MIIHEHNFSHRDDRRPQNKIVVLSCVDVYFVQAEPTL